MTILHTRHKLLSMQKPLNATKNCWNYQIILQNIAKHIKCFICMHQVISHLTEDEDTNVIANISSTPHVFSGKGVLKICSKFTRDYPCQSVISIKLLCNFIGITIRRGCSPVHLPHVFRTAFPKNTSGGLVLCKKGNSSMPDQKHNEYCISW